MGIDIYAEWNGQSEAEKQAQTESWLSGGSGHLGYLREAYHGEPYATRVLVPEALREADGALIPAAVLRERLPETLRVAMERERVVYGKGKWTADARTTRNSFRAFVVLCEKKEAETGSPCRIVASY